MKSFALAASLLLTVLATRPAQAHPQTATRLIPRGFCLFGRPAVRPLTRYLTATLHLTHKQAADVQRTLRGHSTKRLSAERLSLSLSPVLSNEAHEQLLAMQENAASYQALSYLATRR